MKICQFKDITEQQLVGFVDKPAKVSERELQSATFNTVLSTSVPVFIL